MGQLSFFSAETDEATPADLAGLLATGGQTASTSTGGRISVVVDAAWRAEALVDEILRTGVDAETAWSDEGSPMARTEATAALMPLIAAWTRGAVKIMPPGWVPSPCALRLWVLAAGRPDGGGRYLLGLDPHTPESHAALATALMRVGIAPTLIGTRGRSPALRIAGHRRISRLLETVGEPPAYAGAEMTWPVI